MTLRTCDPSVRAIAAICGADMPVEDANTMIARWRLDWYLAFREIDFNRAPSSGESARTNTSGGRIATSMLVMHPSSPRTASFRSNVHGRPTSDPDLSAEDVALGYKNLLEAERGFRDLKTTLELRPAFHRLEHRIRAHILICWLALLLIRISERKTSQTWRRIALELQRLHLVTLTGPDGTVQQTTPISDTQRGILNALAITAPPRITTLQPT